MPSKTAIANELNKLGIKVVGNKVKKSDIVKAIKVHQPQQSKEISVNISLDIQDVRDMFETMPERKFDLFWDRLTDNQDELDEYAREALVAYIHALASKLPVVREGY